MNCKKAEPHITAYLLGELTPDIEEKIAEHIADCADCHRLHDNLAQTIDQIQVTLRADEKDVALSQDRITKIFKETLSENTLSERQIMGHSSFSWKMAAGITLVAGVTLLIYLWKIGSVTKHVTAELQSRQNEITLVAQKELLKSAEDRIIHKSADIQRKYKQTDPIAEDSTYSTLPIEKTETTSTALREEALSKSMPAPGAKARRMSQRGETDKHTDKLGMAETETSLNGNIAFDQSGMGRGRFTSEPALKETQSIGGQVLSEEAFLDRENADVTDELRIRIDRSQPVSNVKPSDISMNRNWVNVLLSVMPGIDKITKPLFVESALLPDKENALVLIVANQDIEPLSATESQIQIDWTDKKSSYKDLSFTPSQIIAPGESIKHEIKLGEFYAVLLEVPIREKDSTLGSVTLGDKKIQKEINFPDSLIGSENEISSTLTFLYCVSELKHVASLSSSERPAFVAPILAELTKLKVKFPDNLLLNEFIDLATKCTETD
ncbi:MAG: zf-HC2 domain-containing protein [Lentisphaerae bacterium]|nr:zf-HC2 domain-containing protein [Lentisphaerota bacterium]